MKVVIRIERGHVGLTGFAVAVTLASMSASAQTKSTPDDGTPADRAALAETLFEKGKARMAEHRYDEACPMFEESQRLDPGGGTLLALGLCHERQGKTATAWSELKEALARAVQDGERDRQAVAKAHVDALEPKLSRLTIRIDSASAKTSGLTIVRDGLALARPAWGLATPVDPGEHHIEAAASNKERWSTTVRVDPDGASVDVDVPMLADVPAPDAATIVPAAPVLPPRGPSARTVGALTFAGLGVASLGIGVFYGARALAKQSDANARCPTSACDDDQGLQANASAHSAAIVADVAIPLGVALGATGALLFLTAPKPRDPGAPALSWNLVGSPRGAFGTLERAF